MLKKLLLIAVLILAAAFILNGIIPRTTPPGLELNVSENITPGVSVVVLDSDKNVVTSVDMDEWFFMQQRGLTEGTTYGFRIIDENGYATKPVYETFTAKPAESNWVESNNYYHGFALGNYTLELLVISGGNGTIVARTNFSIFSLAVQQQEFEALITANCSHLMSEPDVDADGFSREGKIADCVATMAIGQRNTYACSLLYKLFNVTLFDDCIRVYAVATGDASVCDLAGMPKSRGFCKAKVTGDWTECRKITCDISCAMESIETQSDLCIQWYAIETRNSSLCDEIVSEQYDMKNICFEITTG